MGACSRQAPEIHRMTRDELKARTKKVLAGMARRKGIAGWQTMQKEELVQALSASPRPRRAKVKVAAAKSPRPRPQRAAARNTSAPTAEEEVERSKYEV